MSHRISICFLLAAPALSWAQADEQTKASIKYVQSLQQADGGFRGASPGNVTAARFPSSLRATSSAIRALKYFGGELPNLGKTAKFVESCLNEKTGGYADVPTGTPDVFLTAVGIMAAAELKLDVKPFIDRPVAYLTANAKDAFEDIRIAAAGLEAAQKSAEPAAEKWRKQAEAMANGDGSYGKPDADARMTGSAVVLLLRVGGKVDAEALKKTTAVLRAGQRDDGGFGKADAMGSDLETTYRIMRAFHMLKENPKEVGKLREFVAKCRNADGGYGMTPGQPSNVGATYFAAIIQHWLK